MSTAYAATGIGGVLSMRRQKIRVTPADHRQHLVNLINSPRFVEWYCGANGMIRAALNCGLSGPKRSATII